MADVGRCHADGGAQSNGGGVALYPSRGDGSGDGGEESAGNVGGGLGSGKGGSGKSGRGRDSEDSRAGREDSRAGLSSGRSEGGTPRTPGRAGLWSIIQAYKEKLSQGLQELTSMNRVRNEPLLDFATVPLLVFEAAAELLGKGYAYSVDLISAAYQGPLPSAT